MVTLIRVECAIAFPQLIYNPCNIYPTMIQEKISSEAIEMQRQEPEVKTRNTTTSCYGF